MSDFQILQGDEIKIVIRRKTIVASTTVGQPDEEKIENFEIGSVSVPDSLVVTGGTIAPEWDDNQCYLVFRLKAGTAS